MFRNAFLKSSLSFGTEGRLIARGKVPFSSNYFSGFFRGKKGPLAHQGRFLISKKSEVF